MLRPEGECPNFINFATTSAQDHRVGVFAFLGADFPLVTNCLNRSLVSDVAQCMHMWCRFTQRRRKSYRILHTSSFFCQLSANAASILRLFGMLTHLQSRNTRHLNSEQRLNLSNLRNKCLSVISYDD